MVKDLIIKALQKVTRLKDIHVEYPEREEYGDYSSNIALQMFSKSGSRSTKSENPRQLAEEIKAKLETDKELLKLIGKIEIAGPGFINFYLKPEFLEKKLEEINEDFGNSDVNKNKKVIVEYSSPNIAKPFTVGHLRSTIIGDSIANILEWTGYKVYRDNHIGDWGTQFGKQIYALKTWGDEQKIEESPEPVKELVKLYVKFHEEAEKDLQLEEEGRAWFKKLEDGDKEARRIWQKCIDWSFREFEKIYSKLGISFSKDFNDGKGLGESFFEDKMKPVLDELKKKNLLEMGKEGAKLVFFKNDKFPPLMIIKGDGATLYSTRDLATDKYRKEKYNPDLIINEVGVEQSLYFKQIYEIEYLLGWYKPGQRVHIGHGFFKFKEGKMSTRKGNVVWLEDVLVLAQVKAMNLISTHNKTVFGDENIRNMLVVEKDLGKIDLSWDIGIGALKYNDLKRDLKQDIIFDWDEILNMQGNSGPYIQYTYARTRSVLANVKLISNNLQLKHKLQKPNKEELSIMRALVKFPEIVESAAKTYSPNVICNYVYDLASKYNTFYNKHKIIGGENEKFRIMLTEKTGVVLKNGLNLLRIKAPEKM